MQTKLVQLMAALAIENFSLFKPVGRRRQARLNQSESQRVERLEAAKEKRLRREARNRKAHGHE